jgi:hypothetical protein
MEPNKIIYCPDTPEELDDLMATWMIEYGPDGHCDGHEEIAKLAWQWCWNKLYKD